MALGAPVKFWRQVEEHVVPSLAGSEHEKSKALNVLG
jgi:hypothetical protein